MCLFFLRFVFFLSACFFSFCVKQSSDYLHIKLWIGSDLHFNFKYVRWMHRISKWYETRDSNDISCHCHCCFVTMYIALCHECYCCTLRVHFYLNFDDMLKMNMKIKSSRGMRKHEKIILNCWIAEKVQRVSLWVWRVSRSGLSCNGIRPMVSYSKIIAAEINWNSFQIWGYSVQESHPIWCESFHCGNGIFLCRSTLAEFWNDKMKMEKSCTDMYVEK